MNDLRQALRSLRRSPGFVSVAVALLGLAIGAAAAIFSVVDAVLLDPLPYGDADRLISIRGTAPGSDLPPEFPLAAEFYVQYREQSKLLEDISTYGAFTSTLRADERIERITMSFATWTLFPTLGAKPILGRLPTPEDEDRVVLISYELWSSWFGNDPDVVGRTYYVSGSDRTVIGVMGPDFHFPNDRVLLWLPGVIRPEGLVPGRFGAGLVARVAPGVGHDELIAELGTLARQLPERFGGSPTYAGIIERFRPIVRPLEEELLGDVAGPLWVLLAAVGIVLLIACANVANLFTARGERRQRDLAVRRALGAGRRRLIREQMAEAVVVAVLAGAFAVAFALFAVPFLRGVAPPIVPRIADVQMTGTTVLFILGAALFSALLCGLGPALRFSAPRLSRLRDGSRSFTRRAHWGRHALVVAQTALALVLLIASGLLVRSYRQLRAVDPGYDTEDLFTFQIAPEQRADLSDAESYARFHLDFMNRLAALPGVESVGIVENMPLDESVARARFRTAESGVEADGGTLLGFTWAAGDYFRTMGIDLLGGAIFSEADQRESLGHVVVSRAAADLLWPGEDPVGRRLLPENVETPLTVIGVVEDVLQYSFRDEAQPLVYFPLVGPSPQNRPISSPAYVLKTPRAGEIGTEVRALVREVAPHAPMYRVYTMEELATRSRVALTFTMATLLVAASLALLLGAIGLYGVLAYVVAERTPEIGLRMALGAEAGRVQRMVVAQGARVLVLGAVVGAGVAVAATRALGSLLFGVASLDVLTFAGMSAALLAVGLLASYVPARRASRVDPITSLRMD